MEFERRRKRGGAGLRKARCVRKYKAKGHGLKAARRHCHVSVHKRK